MNLLIIIIYIIVIICTISITYYLIFNKYKDKYKDKSIHNLDLSFQPLPGKQGEKRGNYVLQFVDTFKNLDNWNIESGLDLLTNTCARYEKKAINIDPEGGVNLTYGPIITDSTKCCGTDPGGHNKCTDGTCIEAPRMSSKYSQKYGIFTFYAKIPKRRDLFPALWLTSLSGPWPAAGEIDIMETVNTHKNRPNFTSRVMVPIDSDFLTPKSKNYYVGVSVPPDDKSDDQI